MNTTSDLAHSAKDTAEKLAHQAQDFARKEPALTTAAAVGVALGWHILPTRLLFRTVAATAGVLIRPALLCLGALKTYEMYCSAQAPGRSGSPKGAE